MGAKDERASDRAGKECEVGNRGRRIARVSALTGVALMLAASAGCARQCHGRGHSECGWHKASERRDTNEGRRQTGGDHRMALQERTGVVTTRGTPRTLLGPDLKVGDPAPDFQVVDGAFKPVRLSDFSGKVVLLSTVPSLDTNLCSVQTRRFNAEAENLPPNVVVLTVSEDLPFAQTRFCDAENVKRIQVLSDSVSRDLGTKFGILIKENSLLTRSVWVISPDRKIVYRQIVPDTAQEPDYDKALEAAKAVK
jgi:thiol peroxidase